jgi:hypothetical protein
VNVAYAIDSESRYALGISVHVRRFSSSFSPSLPLQYFDAHTHKYVEVLVLLVTELLAQGPCRVALVLSLWYVNLLLPVESFTNVIPLSVRWLRLLTGH